MAGWYSTMWTFHNLFFHSSVDGDLGSFHLLATVSNGVVWVPVFSSLEYISRSGFTGPYGNFMFSFLRDHQTVFHTGCTVLCSHQLWRRVPMFPHPHWYLFSVSLITAILVGVKLTSSYVNWFNLQFQPCSLPWFSTTKKKLRNALRKWDFFFLLLWSCLSSS